MIEIRTEHCICVKKGAFSVLYLSDFHFNRWSSKITYSIIQKIDDLNPDILLLGGDYVDSRRGFLYFKFLMKALSERKNVFAIAGNHDYFWGLSEIRATVTDNKGVWIEKTSVQILIDGIKIQIEGNNPKKNQNSDFKILCLHKPIDIEKYNYDLVFAGHLHGGQIVLWQTKKGLYPARFFYKWNTLRVQLKSTLYLISKGLGDTLPIRYNCKRDIIHVRVNTEIS